MKTYSFTHVGRIDTMNEVTNLARSNKFGAASHRKQEIESIKSSIIESETEIIPAGLYDAVIVWSHPLRQDSDNFIAKSLLDAIVRCGAEYETSVNAKGKVTSKKVGRGILTDDNPKNIRNIMHFHRKSQSYHTVVTLVPHGYTLKWLLENGYDQF